ncbi:hypothetical protein D6C13_24385 [Rahnella woolbedingensis]|uniref:Bacterial Ig-like domain-containing protein n=1 Tax=Rahnella woolbedingensis TaxID=1510574 RepID=A0A419N1X6_9GAMM|nr:hypothetical protein D6C13_24385 [Rahnella woolbedingensis]
MMVYDGAVVIGSVTADSKGVWICDVSQALADGKHSFTATATDAAGNTSAHSGHFVLDVETADTTPPDAPTIIDFYDDAGDSKGHDTNGGTTDDTTPTLNGHAEANSIVKVYEGSTLLGSTTAKADGSWSYTTPVRADGKHDFTATATDAAGNISAHSGHFVIITEAPDTTPPVQPTIDTFHDEAGNFSSGATSDDSTPTLQGHAEANSIVKVYEGSTLLGSTTAHSDGTWSYTTPVRADGKHDFTATATDAAGNISAHSGDFVVNIDTAPPGVSGFEDFEASSVNGDYFTSLTTDSGLKIESAERARHYLDTALTRITTGSGGESNGYIDNEDDGLIKFTLPGIADTVSFFGWGPRSTSIHAYDENGHELAVTVSSRPSTTAEQHSYVIFMYKYDITPAPGQHIASFTSEGNRWIDDVSWTSAGTSHAAQQSALLTTPDAVDHHDIMTLAQIDDSHKSTAAVDITDHVQNTLHLTLNDILSEAHPNLFVQDGKQQLAVTGDQGDVVELKVDDLAHNTWQDSGAVTAGGVQYEVYQHAGSDVELLVQHGLELHQVS